MEIMPEHCYRPKDVPKREIIQAKTRILILSVTIVTRKNICHKIVGQKEVDAKVKDLKDEKDQIVEINQIRCRRQILI